MVTLDIFSDPICPWCYLGKAWLDRALETAGDNPFDIRWRPFQLNPDMPPEGMDRRAYLEGKFGGKEGAVKAYLPVQQAADEAGVPIALDQITRTPNTLDAHRLLHWAGLEQRQSFVQQGLFNAYFREGLDISDHAVLTDIAGATGMDGAMVTRLLGTDADRELTQNADAEGREMGVNSVPTFVVAGQHAVVGAQRPELWAEVIKDVRAQLDG